MLTALLGDGNDLIPLKRLIIERTEEHALLHRRDSADAIRRQRARAERGG